MEGTLEDPLVEEPSHDNPDNVKDAVISNGVNGDCTAEMEQFEDDHEDKTTEGMEIDEPQESQQSHRSLEPDELLDGGTNHEDDEEIDAPDNGSLVEVTETHENDVQSTEDVSGGNNISEVKDTDKTKINSCDESMDVDRQSNTSDIECLDEGTGNSNVKTINLHELDDVSEIIDESKIDEDDPLNESVETISSVDNSDLKIVEENGSVGSIGSPDIEEITESKSNGHNASGERSPNAPKKKQRSKIDLSSITPRRSSRNIKRTSYIEKEPEDPEDDGSDIEEIKPEDPLACVVDGKDKENTKLKSPLKTSKTTIVVNDTKRLVEIAAGSKCMKGGKKEPTLVIIDTNSILSGRGGVPVSSSKSHSVSSSSAFSVMPVNLTGTTTMYPNMRTTITPVPMTSKSTPQLSPKLGSSITAVPTPPPPAPQILPTLTDDMFVVEAPSFIVPYVYEKPPLKPLKEFVTKLEKCIKQRDQEDREREEREKLNKDKDKDDSSEQNDSDNDDDMLGKKEGDPDFEITPKFPEDRDKAEDRNKVQTYFDLPLGKFFMQIGVNLVQEFVQTDLLRQQKHKQRKGGQASAETQIAINSLIKNLEFSKENNEPFHLEMKKCEFCSFKTESSLVMQHHLETPHMRNYVYKCNFCPLEVRSPHDILFHMEAEHNTRGRLERGPAFHQCPNCPFEDNQKGKLTRHILTCAKKFRPERNLEPSGDWEPPAKIPRLNRPRPVGPLNTNAIAMAMGAKGPQPLLPKLLPAPMAGRGRGRPPMQPRYTDLKSLRPGGTSVRQDSVGGMMYRPTSSGLLVPTSYQFGSNQIFQNTSITASKNPAAKLLSQPSISITPLPRTTTQAPISGSGSSSKPGGKNTFVICEICDGYIKDLEQLRNHMQWIHKVKIHPKMIYNRPPLNCQKCQFRFFTDQGLERHLLGSHGLVTSSMQEAANKGKDAGRCPACGRVYQWKLLNHVARDHGMTLKPAHLSYKCTVCTATFGMYKQFENHVYSAHSVVAKRVMDKKSTPSSPSSRSNDSLLKPLKINDEITIIPQPAKPTTRSGNTQGRSK
ncbi:uncharacterized protein MEP-1 [Fopius arisanus]|uniref:MOG interacting and ectopic P-granules protein 1 n=1 Tax=Fopius arisanus TaxID=64838 RepID=A0A0C9R3N6_9HYME|nr:PREDICTED: uncharacterized protein LOC105273361 [Fopius arisanus]XP_011314064.1 PREDICTED: uncharacterized protein LOC105273361 [Fopius arisanus]